MKKVFLFAICLVCFMGFYGCAGKKDAEFAKQDRGEFKGAPSWVIDSGSSYEGGLASVGSARIGDAGISFARTEAMANARSELARQFGVKVKDLVENFTKTTGIGDAQTVDKVTENVTSQVAQQTLTGSKPKNSWISESATLYILVVIDPASTINNVKNAVKTSLKNEEALWQQFQAQKAHDKLDKAVEKEFGDFKN